MWGLLTLLLFHVLLQFQKMHLALKVLVECSLLKKIIQEWVISSVPLQLFISWNFSINLIYIYLSKRFSELQASKGVNLCFGADECETSKSNVVSQIKKKCICVWEDSLFRTMLSLVMRVPYSLHLTHIWEITNLNSVWIWLSCSMIL